MEASQKAEVLRALQSGRDAVQEAVAGVDKAFAMRRPSPQRWSILECVEHMIESERQLLTRLQAATMADQPFEKSRREAKIAALAADRTRRIEAPEPVHPRGRYKTLVDALAAFDATRAEVVRWVENCAGDPRRSAIGLCYFAHDRCSASFHVSLADRGNRIAVVHIDAHSAAP